MSEGLAVDKDGNVFGGFAAGMDFKNFAKTDAVMAAPIQSDQDRWVRSSACVQNSNSNSTRARE
jgi:hypothetical protein